MFKMKINFKCCQWLYRLNIALYCHFLMKFQTIPNQAIFSIEAGVGKLFREFLDSRGFHEVHTPKIISG